MALKVNINPYPVRYRLPGDKTACSQNLTPIVGPARRSIVHALTYHELPPRIDELIDRLRTEEDYSALSPLQKSYLSFTVYSLKQMVAAGSVSAETAWQLFYGEERTIERVDEVTFFGFRQNFWQEAVKQAERPGGKPDLLQLEFFTRAGAAGLAQFERYGEWAEKLAFRDKDHLTEAQKDEYRKALWLEMRLIEERVGLTGLNEDISQFKLDEFNAEYWHNYVRAAIDLFAPGRITSGMPAGSGLPVDAHLKAEIGHWLFNLFHLREYNELGREKSSAAAELADRMNIAGYTPRINRAFGQEENDGLPPEMRAFLDGGYYYSSIDGDRDPETAYPVYPQEFSGHSNTEKHARAESGERLLRIRLRSAVGQGQIGEGEAYALYRQTGIYAALLYLEGKNGSAEERWARVNGAISAFDIGEIRASFGAARERAAEGIKEAFAREKGPLIRGSAARKLLFLAGANLPAGESERLSAYKIIGEIQYLVERSMAFLVFKEGEIEQKMSELGALGEAARPAIAETIEHLMPVLQGNDPPQAILAAKMLYALKGMVPDFFPP